jgi:hypothetical protein
VAGKTTILEWRSNLSGALSGLERLDARVTQGFAEKRSALGWYLSAFQAEERTPADGADFFDTLWEARGPKRPVTQAAGSKWCSAVSGWLLSACGRRTDPA